jgi:hypothetical protein
VHHREGAENETNCDKHRVFEGFLASGGCTDEDQLTQAILALAAKYGRYGYRRITALLQHAGWPVGKDRVQRIWRREGLKVPQKQRARGRLWLGDGSCVRLRPERKNHVWSYDFVKAMTNDGTVDQDLNRVRVRHHTDNCMSAWRGITAGHGGPASRRRSLLAVRSRRVQKSRANKWRIC